MTLTAIGWTILATIVLATIVMAGMDDVRVIRWLRETWSSTVGAWFTRRRLVGRFCDKRHARIRVGEPDEHSAGIMSSRRDINTGVWS